MLRRLRSSTAASESRPRSVNAHAEIYGVRRGVPQHRGELATEDLKHRALALSLGVRAKRRASDPACPSRRAGTRTRPRSSEGRSPVLAWADTTARSRATGSIERLVCTQSDVEELNPPLGGERTHARACHSQPIGIT